MEKDYDFIQKATNLSLTDTESVFNIHFKLKRLEKIVTGIFTTSITLFGVAILLLTCIPDNPNTLKIVRILATILLVSFLIFILSGMMMGSIPDPLDSLNNKIEHTLIKSHIILPTFSHYRSDKIYSLYKFAILINQEDSARDCIKKATKLHETGKILAQSDLKELIGDLHYQKLEDIYNEEQDKLIKKLYLIIKPNIYKIQAQANKLQIIELMPQNEINKLKAKRGEEILNELKDIH